MFAFVFVLIAFGVFKNIPLPLKKPFLSCLVSDKCLCSLGSLLWMRLDSRFVFFHVDTEFCQHLLLLFLKCLILITFFGKSFGCKDMVLLCDSWFFLFVDVFIFPITFSGYYCVGGVCICCTHKSWCSCWSKGSIHGYHSLLPLCHVFQRIKFRLKSLCGICLYPLSQLTGLL